jgi:hypothetical protein
MRCRHCGTPLQHTLIDLGMSPLCESFLTHDQLNAPETYYPLHARVCHSCWLVQLPEFVSPAHIFTEYAYFSSYSTTWVAHAARYCETIKSRLGLGPKSFVVELGSNDGYLFSISLNSACRFSASNPLPMWRKPLERQAFRRWSPSSVPKLRDKW